MSSRCALSLDDKHMWRFIKRWYGGVLCFKCEHCDLTTSLVSKKFWGEPEPEPHRHMWRFQKRAYSVVMVFKCEECQMTVSSHENKFWGRAAYYRFHRRYVGGNGP